MAGPRTLSLQLVAQRLAEAQGWELMGVDTANNMLTMTFTTTQTERTVEKPSERVTALMKVLATRGVLIVSWSIEGKTIRATFTTPAPD
jgi:hypothetical protein